MDIELLKTFIEVKNTRHFGRAADNLYITQAAVSARIKQMEDFFGVKLFVRNRNNIRLTPEGERLLPHAESMVLAFSRAKQDVALKLEQKNQLSISSTAGLWNYIFQDKIAQLHLHAPELALRTEANSSDDIVRLVLEGVSDIGLLFDAPHLPDLKVTSIGKLKLVLASSIPEVTAKTALKNQYVYVDWGTAFNIFHAKRFKEVSPAILHTDMASVAEAFLISNPASAYLPESMLKTGGINAIKQVDGAPSYSRDVYLIYRSSSENIQVLKTILPALKL